MITLCNSIKFFEEKKMKSLKEKQLIEMANAHVDITGCPCIIWIQTKGKERSFDDMPY